MSLVPTLNSEMGATCLSTRKNLKEKTQTCNWAMDKPELDTTMPFLIRSRFYKKKFQTLS